MPKAAAERRDKAMAKYPARECVTCLFERDGVRCKLRTCRQYPYCWIHLKYLHGLQVKNVGGGGVGKNRQKGLFYVGTRDTKSVPPGKNIACYSSLSISKTGSTTSAGSVRLTGTKFMNSEKELNHAGRYINSHVGTTRKANVKFSGDMNPRMKGGRYVLNVKTTRTVKAGEELLL